MTLVLVQEAKEEADDKDEEALLKFSIVLLWAGGLGVAQGCDSGTALCFPQQVGHGGKELLEHHVDKNVEPFTVHLLLE